MIRQQYIEILTYEQKQAGYFVSQTEDCVFLWQSLPYMTCIGLWLYDQCKIKDIRDMASKHMSQIVGDNRLVQINRKRAILEQRALYITNHYDISLPELQVRSRNKKLNAIRQTTMYLLWKTDGYTLSDIGQILGGRTPATISLGIKQTLKLLDTHPKMKGEIEALETKIGVIK